MDTSTTFPVRRVLSALLGAAIGGPLFWLTWQLVVDPFFPNSPDDPPPGLGEILLSLVFFLSGLPGIGFAASALLWKDERPGSAASITVLFLAPLVAVATMVVVEPWVLVFGWFLAPFVFLGSLAGELFFSTRDRRAALAAMDQGLLHAHPGQDSSGSR